MTNRRNRLLSLLLSSSVALAAGCADDAEPGPDAATDPDVDAGASFDAGPSAGDAGSGADAGESSTATDAGGGGCVAATVSDWRLDRKDDVSVRYRARLAPEIDRQPWDLYLLFNRYETEYVGDFALGEGQDANYGSCARCVTAFFGTTETEGYFAVEGTLSSRVDPFTQRLDVTLSGVRLIEVTIDVGPGGLIESVPVEGGACIELAQTTVEQTFPSEGWTCPTEQFDDGAACHCGCGAFDPDCGEQCPFPPEPGCDDTPLPVEGCEADQLCSFDGECVGSCDHDDRVPCDGGVCGFDVEGDRCFDRATDRVDDAALGESCDDGNRHCAVDGEGFVMGVCDDIDAWLCRPVCYDDDDCTGPDELCYLVAPDEAAQRGYCRPPATDG